MLVESDLHALKPSPARKYLKVFDRGGVKGLYLLVRHAQSHCWRFKYQYAGAENSLSFGLWPKVTLAEARQRARAVRSQLSEGLDPGALRRQQRAARKEAARQQRLQRGRERKRANGPAEKIPTPAHPMPRGCECCGRAPSGGRFSLSRDHCHRTKTARGWLCARCNMGLGFLGDDLEGVENLRRYLLKYSKFAWLYTDDAASQ
jgi:hypothetical protein